MTKLQVCTISSAGLVRLSFFPPSLDPRFASASQPVQGLDPLFGVRDMFPGLDPFLDPRSELVPFNYIGRCFGMSRYKKSRARGKEK